MKVSIIQSLILAAAFSMLGCSTGPSPKTSPLASQPWTPDAEEQLPTLPAANQIPDDFQEAAQQLTLEQLIDLSLRNNERTKIAWLRARAAAETLGSSKGQFYPNISIGAEYAKSRSNFSDRDVRDEVFEGDSGSGSSSVRETHGPFVSLSWLIFDFGRREANVQQFRQALIQANFDHNTEIQNVIFDVIQSFYRYLSFKALAAAQDLTIQETLKNLDYADQRYRAGLATIADVHQARTSASRAKYIRQSTEGQIQSLRGLVATAVGLGPDAKFEVAPVALDAIPVNEIATSVEELIRSAQQSSPEVAAARAEASRAGAAYDATRRRRFPAIVANYEPNQDWSREDEFEMTYTASIGITMPLFTGWSLTHDIRRARHERDIAESEMRDSAKILALRIWNDYFAIKTAEQQIVTSRELLESATISSDVASARYREGVGTILDLLTAEGALQQARAAAVEARTIWLVAVAALAKDSGKLRPRPLTDNILPSAPASNP